MEYGKVYFDDNAVFIKGLLKVSNDNMSWILRYYARRGHNDDIFLENSSYLSQHCCQEDIGGTY